MVNPQVSAPFRKTTRPTKRRRPKVSGGDEGDRTHDLRIANATLSQLSYVPTTNNYSAKPGRGWLGADVPPTSRGRARLGIRSSPCLENHDAPTDPDRRRACRHRPLFTSHSGG